MELGRVVVADRRRQAALRPEARALAERLPRDHRHLGARVGCRQRRVEAGAASADHDDVGGLRSGPGRDRAAATALYAPVGPLRPPPELVRARHRWPSRERRRLTAIEEALRARLARAGAGRGARRRARAASARPRRGARRLDRGASRERGGGMIDLDTVASAGLVGGGAARGRRRGPRAADGCSATGGFAFCGLRPPGTTPSANRAMGFCLFNNVAVAAAHALEERGVERVLILDWDVHHGNGTEAIFYGRPRSSTRASTRARSIPGTGAATDFGRGRARATRSTCRCRPAAGRTSSSGLVQHVVAPVARASGGRSCSASRRATTPIATTRSRSASWTSRLRRRWRPRCATSAPSSGAGAGLPRGRLRPARAGRVGGRGGPRWRSLTARRPAGR